jgi:hypothetical protein
VSESEDSRNCQMSIDGSLIVVIRLKQMLELLSLSKKSCVLRVGIKSVEPATKIDVESN